MQLSVLVRSPLFRGLTESEIEKLLSGITYRVKHYPAGTMAALSGEEISSVMIILSGSMRGEMMDISGRTVKIEDINPPQALAAAFIYGTESRYPVSVTANNDSEILVIDRADYLSLMQKEKKILANYLNVVCTKALFLSDRLRFLSFHTIKGKYAHYLTSLPGYSTGRVTVDKTQKELSDYFGVTRPSLARVVRGMEKDGLISVDRRNVVLKDIKGLAALTAL
ncbi:MAG: Crp/Fnr family transcriptional regulator [Bacteroidales bacterium]|jgi:CRP-like cAMP-binding protein|nr:Crp/Fnr family transcriptional regulator [Bacteroidales bacterium]